MEEFKKILSSFQVKDTLNPKIWTNVDNEEQSKMHPEVKEALLAIANEFIEFLNVDIFVSDVTMTGSLANYNWSKFSDVDLHLYVIYTSCIILMRQVSSKKFTKNSSK